MTAPVVHAQITPPLNPTGPQDHYQRLRKTLVIEIRSRAGRTTIGLNLRMTGGIYRSISRWPDALRQRLEGPAFGQLAAGLPRGGVLAASGLQNGALVAAVDGGRPDLAAGGQQA